jgi:GTPase SAR1 family protein
MERTTSIVVTLFSELSRYAIYVQFDRDGALMTTTVGQHESGFKPPATISLSAEVNSNLQDKIAGSPENLESDQQKHILDFAAVPRIGLTFIPGADSPQVTRLEQIGTAGQDPDQKDANWRSNTAASLLGQFSKLAHLQEYCVEDDIPRIVVCGDQSSGKSSVPYALTGVPFPRKDDDVCTRFASEIILRRDTTDSLTMKDLSDESLAPTEKEKTNSIEECALLTDGNRNPWNNKDVGDLGAAGNKTKSHITGPTRPMEKSDPCTSRRTGILRSEPLKMTGFKIDKSKCDFFTPGRIFKVLWAEPGIQESLSVSNSIKAHCLAPGRKIFSAVIRFVFIDTREGRHSMCL